MSISKRFLEFKACLSNRLAEAGFAINGEIFSLKANDVLIVFEIQKDRKYSSKDEIQFTIDVGISVDALRVAAEDTNLLAISKPVQYHWRERLGRLLQARSDAWWLINDRLSAQLVCDEITVGILETALPKINAIASTEALIRLWQSGNGKGLTEYERRANLVKLLIALVRLEEADIAMWELEESSIGKSWEISAKQDIKIARQKLLQRSHT